MSKVKRYDPMGYDKMSGYMSEHAEGDYVRHDDCAALEAECEMLRKQVAALQSDANSWQSGYDKGREDGAKAAEGWKGQHARDSAELRRLCAERDSLAAERNKLAAALERIADTDPDDGSAWFHDVANAAISELTP